VAFEKDPFNIIITGVGGQGNVLASQILGQMLVQQGYIITIGETYGASQRGGSVMSHIRVSQRDQFSPLIPEGKCDLVVGLEPVEALRVLAKYGNPGVLMLINTRPIYPIDVIAGNASYPELSVLLKKIQRLSRRVWMLNATEIGLELGDPIFSNIVMLGALSALDLLPLHGEEFQKAIQELLPSQKLHLNMEAFERGREAVQELPL
jgi:indolepyruvate ferredoxin oxidoreductase, beta subunit